MPGISLEVPVLIALVQLCCQDLEVGKVNLKEAFEAGPLNFDHNLLACMKRGPMHLDTASNWSSTMHIFLMITPMRLLVMQETSCF